MTKIPKVSAAQFAELPAKLSTTHWAVMSAGNAGTISDHAAKASFSYDPTAETLSVNVTHHSFFHEAKTVEAALVANITAAIAPPAAAPVAAAPVA